MAHLLGLSDMKNKGGKSYLHQVKLDLTGLDFLQKRLVDFSTKKVRWGYIDSTYVGDDEKDRRNGLPVAVIAMWHEYRQAAGQGGYPKRPFFTQSIPRAKAILKNALPFLFGQELLGRIKREQGGVENAFQHRVKVLALNLCKTVQQEIDSGNFAPLSQRVLAEKARKGYPLDILKETLQLRNKIQWMVYSPKAYGKNKIVIGNVNDDTKVIAEKGAMSNRKTKG